MVGLDMIHGTTKMAMLRYFDRYYGSGFVDPGKFEDFVLTTPRRDNYSDTGTGQIYLDTVQYVLTNMPWINVCMFVNADFRECFHDAVLIEKALLQVSRKDYADFRDEMTIPVRKESQEAEKVVGINLAAYDNGTDNYIGMSVASGMDTFFGTGMGEAYGTLLNELDGDARDGVLFMAYNIAYVINALDKNGVFRKYVTIVIENVKRQLLG